MRKNLMMLALMSVLILGGSLGLQAQTGTGNNDAGTAGYADTRDDNDTDWGWIGLLGLAGLMGLKRREVHRDTRATTTAPVR